LRPPVDQVWITVIHHSDRGVQYASIAYRQRLADRDITISMSRPGNPFDNAKAESFMKTLKTEEINGKAFADISDARASRGAIECTVTVIPATSDSGSRQ